MGILERLLGNHHRSGHCDSRRHGKGHRQEDDRWPAEPSAPPSAAGGALATCRSCDAVSASGAKFCNQCGKSLMSAKCDRCSAVVQPGAKFCAECGARAP